MWQCLQFSNLPGTKCLDFKEKYMMGESIIGKINVRGHVFKLVLVHVGWFTLEMFQFAL